MGFRINFRAFLIYIFCMIILFLAGSTIGGLFLFLFYVFLFFPFFSLVRFIICLVKIRFYQNFDNEHPLKGEVVGYRLSVSNEAPFVNAKIKIQFKAVFPEGDEMLDDIYLCLKRNQTEEYNYEIRCRYRGIYIVGIETITITEALGWIRHTRKEWHRTFYVYPRIIPLSRFSFFTPDTKELIGNYPGFTQDISLVNNLVPYREGESLRHLSWKKFAATGEPFLKEYNKSSWQGLEIYIDLRREAKASPDILMREDCSIEIAVALVKYFLENGIPVSVHAISRERFDFKASDVFYFPEFHKSTISLFFGKAMTPSRLFSFDLEEIHTSFNSVFFITHIVDASLFEISSTIHRSRIRIGVIVNQAGMDDAGRKECEDSSIRLQEAGCLVRFVKNADTIKDDLEL